MTLWPCHLLASGLTKQQALCISRSILPGRHATHCCWYFLENSWRGCPWMVALLPGTRKVLFEAVTTYAKVSNSRTLFTLVLLVVTSFPSSQEMRQWGDVCQSTLYDLYCSSQIPLAQESLPLRAQPAYESLAVIEFRDLDQQWNYGKDGPRGGPLPSCSLPQVLDCMLHFNVSI